jgi:hypothetical protein
MKPILTPALSLKERGFMTIIMQNNTGKRGTHV